MAFKIGVIGSGKGSNFQAIADAIRQGDLPEIEIAVVLSDVKEAYILERAKKMGVKSVYLDPGKFKTKLEEDREQEYIRVLKENDVSLVVLAGFMRMIKKNMLDAFPHKIINIHPSLLPSFPGLDSFKQAHDYGVKITGCTVHFVDEDMDTGPIIGQRGVPILSTDSAETVHEKIQKEEHILYPACIKAIAQGKLEIIGRRVIMKVYDKKLNNLL